MSSSKMAKILDGVALSKTLKLELKENIKSWVSQGYRNPHLACILVGNDPASATYVSKKVEAAEFVGIKCTLEKYEEITQKDLIDKIDVLNKSDDVDGILIQLPLPETINERDICNAVCPAKDVDGFHIENVGMFCLDMDAMLPCTALGVMEIIKRYNIETFGKSAVVVGRSKNVGMPIAMLLHSDGNHESRNGMDATVTICHRYTPPEQLAMFCKNADIIVSATGIRNLIKADMVKPGAVIIDVGIIRFTDPETGKTRLGGDVDYEEVSKKASAITPVPGGVGPMTVTMLMSNTFKAAKNIAMKLNI